MRLGSPSPRHIPTEFRGNTWRWDRVARPTLHVWDTFEEIAGCREYLRNRRRLLAIGSSNPLQ